MTRLKRRILLFIYKKYSNNSIGAGGENNKSSRPTLATGIGPRNYRRPRSFSLLVSLTPTIVAAYFIYPANRKTADTARTDSTECINVRETTTP